MIQHIYYKNFVREKGLKIQILLRLGLFLLINRLMKKLKMITEINNTTIRMMDMMISIFGALPKPFSIEGIADKPE